MKLVKLLATAALAMSSLAACGGGVEGTYKLDKGEMKKAMEGDIAKLPQEQQGFAKLALALIDQMEMSVELQSGGKLKMKTTTPSLKEGKAAETKEEEGTWKVEGESVVLETNGKPIKCKKGEGKLTCDPEEKEKKEGAPGLVFVKS